MRKWCYLLCQVVKTCCDRAKKQLPSAWSSPLVLILLFSPPLSPPPSSVLSTRLPPPTPVLVSWLLSLEELTTCLWRSWLVDCWLWGRARCQAWESFTSGERALSCQTASVWSGGASGIGSLCASSDAAFKGLPVAFCFHSATRDGRKEGLKKE